MQVRDQNRYSNKFINLLLLFFNFFVKEENQYLFFSSYELNLNIYNKQLPSIKNIYYKL